MYYALFFLGTSKYFKHSTPNHYFISFKVSDEGIQKNKLDVEIIRYILQFLSLKKHASQHAPKKKVSVNF